MRGYLAKSNRRTSGGVEQGTQAHGVARASADAQPVNGASEKAASLLQLRAALDGSPSVRSQVALQRALDKQAEGGKAPVKKKTVPEKPALQKKGVAINDDAGLEREASVMGARANAAPAVIQRVNGDDKQDVKTAAPKPAADTKSAAPKPQGAWKKPPSIAAPKPQTSTTASKSTASPTTTSTTGAAATSTTSTVSTKTPQQVKQIRADIAKRQAAVEKYRETIDLYSDGWNLFTQLGYYQLDSVIRALDASIEARSAVVALHGQLGEGDQGHGDRILVEEAMLQDAEADFKITPKPVKQSNVDSEGFTMVTGKNK